ncbi:hypothetical protein [Desulfobulbus oligotrophicus]|uniref:Uncharacterized protein n=1 Tax=Desulfobulbus oligotrophicus TaxID=1909699 RepID=A0A7T5VEJ6_9BACT|nr:hypothetical protein [Desulfobulbus oligotrophicus]QQG66356.1 hypothetical protein HP555_10995 [Desulfobulbus oligotrophicus]
MRQFIVLGFLSNSANTPGECLYLGTDRGAAMETVNEQGEYARRELYELATPQLRRHAAVDPEPGDEDGDPEPGDEDGDPEPGDEDGDPEPGDEDA